MKRIKFFASILLMLCLSVVCCAQTKIDWKQIKNIPDTLEFKNVLLEHLLFKSAYQPVMESIHQGAIYYDNMTERMRIYENGQWRDLSVTIASDSIGAPLTILGYLQASDIHASQSAYIGKDVNVKGNVNASQSAYIGKDVNVKGNVNASGTSTFNYLKVNNALKVPTVASAALGVGSIYYNPTTKKLNILNSSNQWEPISIEVDSALSTTSTNPVQNKVITAKINQTDANLINGMATTLQQSYNYANGIVTQAYNYADSAATDAETASKNYADLQIRLLNSTISEKLASGTSDLYVRSIRTTNASVTNKLDVNTGKFYDINVSNRVTASETMIQSANINKDLVIGNNSIGGQYNGRYTYRFNSSNVAYRQNQTNALLEDGAHFFAPLTVYGKLRADGSFVLPVKRQSELRDVEIGYMYFDLDTNKVYVYNGSEFVALDGSGGSGTSYETKYLAIPLYGIGLNANNVRAWGECFAYNSSGYYRVVCYVTEENTISNNNVIRTRLTVDPTPRILSDSIPSAGVSGNNMVNIGPANQIANSEVFTPGFICRFGGWVYDRSGDLAQSAIGQNGGFNNATNISVEQGHPIMRNTSCMENLDGSILVYNVIDGDIKYYSGGIQNPAEGSFPPDGSVLFTKDGKNISYESKLSLKNTAYTRDVFSTYVWNITW